MTNEEQIKKWKKQLEEYDKNRIAELEAIRNTPSVPMASSTKNIDATASSTPNRNALGSFLSSLVVTPSIADKFVNEIKNNEELSRKAKEMGYDINSIKTPQDTLNEIGQNITSGVLGGVAGLANDAAVNTIRNDPNLVPQAKAQGLNLSDLKTTKENLDLFGADLDRSIEAFGQGLKSSGSNLGKGTLLFARDMGGATALADKLTNEYRNKSDRELEEIAKKANISTQTLKDYVKNAKTSYENINDFSANTFDKWANEANQRIAELQNETQDEFAKKAIGFMPNLSQQAITMGASLVNPALGTYVASGQAKGSYFNDAKERGMTDEQANNYSTVMAGVEGVTEMLSINNMIKAGKGAKALTKGGIKGAVGELTKKELVDNTIKGTLKSYGKGILENAVQEAITEPIQEAVADMTAGKGNWENIGQRMIEAGINGAISSAITGGVNMGIQSCVEATKPGATPEQIMEAYVDVMAESKNWTDAQKQQFLESVKDSSEAEIQAMKSRIEAENEQNIAQNEQENIEPTETAENAQIGENAEEQQITQEENENALKENVEAQNQEQTQENQTQEENGIKTQEKKTISNKSGYNTPAKDGTIRLYTNTKAENIDSILKDGLLIDKAKEKEYNGKMTWFETTPDLKGYGGTTIAVDVPKNFNMEKLNNTQYGVYDNISPDNIVFIDKPAFNNYRTSDIQDLVDKFGKDKVLEVFDKSRNKSITREELENIINSSTQENLTSENENENLQENLTEEESRLSEEQKTEIKKLRDELKETRELTKKLIQINPSQAAELQKGLKGASSEISARIREATQGDSLIPVKGGLTQKELTNKIDRLKSNYIGKEVTVDGKQGKITKNAFGKVGVQFEDGSEQFFLSKELTPVQDIDKIISEQQREQDIRDAKAKQQAQEKLTNEIKEKVTKQYGEETANKVLEALNQENLTQNETEELNNKPQNDKIVEENKEAENEFRRLQEESRGMSENERELFRRGDRYQQSFVNGENTETTEPLRVAPEQAPKQTNNELLSQDTLKEARNELTPEKKAETLAKIMNKLPEQRTEKESVLLSLLTKLVDRNAVFENLAKKTKNRQLEATADTMMLSQARAQYAIGNERTLSNGQKVKSLDSIIAEVGQNTPQFSEYMYHLLNTDRMSLVERGFGQENKPVFGEDMTAEKSQEIIKQIEKEHPEFKKYAEDVYTYNDRNIEELVSHGVISEDLAKVWKEMYPHYVPISRADVQNNAIAVPLDTNRTGINAPIQRAKGGNGDIQPLFETMANRTEQVYRASDRNLFGLELRKSMKKANMLNEAIEGSSVEAILDGMQDLNDNAGINEVKGQNPTFTVFENGNKVTYEITPDMFSALKPRDPNSPSSRFDNSKFSKVLRGISNFRRNFLTEYNPVFALTNAIKDAQDVLYNSQHAKSTYKNFPEAYAQIVQKGHWYKEYLEAGGEQNSYYKDGQFENFNQDKSKKNVPTWKKAVQFPFEKISKLNNYIETAPRLAEYIASREQGKSIQEAMLDASRVTTNFKAGGDFTKFLNRNGATFLNASVQGLAQNVRNIREASQKGIKGYATLLAKTVVAGTPALILNGLVWDDDEDYEELSDYVKENNYVIGKIGDKFITIPKGRVVAVVQDMVTNVQDYMTGKKELDGEKIAKDLLGTKDLAIANLAPNNPLENNIFSPIVNVATNQTWYGSDLVPTRLQDEKPENQIKEDTDAFSTWLGQTMGWSPIKINYLLDQYGGGLSDILLPMSTPQAEENDFFTDKFVKDATMKNGNPAKFYEMRDSLDKSKTASEEDKVKAKYVEKVNSELNDLYKQQREIQMSPNTDEYKKEAVKNVRSKINELSKNALKEVENFDKKSVPMQTDKSSSTSSTGSVPMSEVKTIGDYTYYKDSDGNWKSLTNADMKKNSNSGISNSTYAQYKQDIQGISDNKEKAEILNSEKLSDKEKSAIYETYIGKNDKTYQAMKLAGVDINDYLDYISTYNGTTKQEFSRYINSTDFTYEQKLLLAGTKYKLSNAERNDLVKYINSLNLSEDEITDIYSRLKGATITANGDIYY